MKGYHWRRKTSVDYALWFAQQSNIDVNIDLVNKSSRPAIEESILAQRTVEIKDEPTEEVFKATSDETIITPEDIPNTEDFPESLSYDSMTVKELKEECKSRGLPIYGTKAELALRLKRNDEGILESMTETEAPVEETAAEEMSDAPSEESEAVTNGETNDSDNEQGTNTTKE